MRARTMDHGNYSFLEEDYWIIRKGQTSKKDVCVCVRAPMCVWEKEREYTQRMSLCNCGGWLSKYEIHRAGSQEEKIMSKLYPMGTS